jgi:hypothetical protein
MTKSPLILSLSKDESAPFKKRDHYALSSLGVLPAEEERRRISVAVEEDRRQLPP